MTAFDRVERHLPELFDELAGAGTPDYFDDMLRSTTQARQRPAWSSLERWLPMGVIARPLPFRPIPWRLIAIVAAVALIATATLVYVGTRARTPAPFGPAKNGVITIGNASGDIVTVDQTTGASSVLIGGATFDGGPAYLYDGRRLFFDRGTSADDQAPGLFMANADGTDARRLLQSEAGVVGLEVSPTGDRLFVTRKIGDAGTVEVVDLATGTLTKLALDLNVASVSWRPNHDQLIIGSDGPNSHGFYVVNPDGTGKRPIAVSPYAIIAPTVSSDGRLLAYATWEPTGLPGRIRVVDIDQGGDHAITTDATDGYVWQSPQFSPDGSHLLLLRFEADSDPVVAQLAVMSVDDGSATAMGPVSENPQPDAMFSPDGTKILATYSTLGKTWLFDADGGNGHEVPFVAFRGETWQRLAP